jgi:hypothetical protein
MISAWRGLHVNSRTVVTVVDILTYVELSCCVVALILMQYRRQIQHFKPLALFLLTRITSYAICIPLMKMSDANIISARIAYQIYFYVYWPSYALEAILGFLIILSIYKLAMAPLQGLQRLGMLMFRWAGGIAVAIAITVACGPHITSTRFIIHAVTQLQQTQSILTLCMLLFVCLAIRPMGLSYRSKIFGVSLGLGLMATMDLVGAAWLSHYKSLYSFYNIANGAAICFTMLIWVGYFAIPEPKRRMIILPTTSPFLRWNQISLALGDEPGFVAVGEVSPDMFAPAEVEVMRRASLKMRQPPMTAQIANQA